MFSDLLVTWRTGCFPLAGVRIYVPPLPSEKAETLDGPYDRKRRRKTHASRPALGNGEAVVQHEGFLHGQHEVRGEALDDNGPQRRLEPHVWIQPVHPRHLCLVWPLRLEVVISLLVALCFFRDAEVLVDDSDEASAAQ